MSTGSKQKSKGIAFINDKNPAMDNISAQLALSGFDILFHSENIDKALQNLETINAFPEACILGLNFQDKHIMEEIRQFTIAFPKMKFIAYSDNDNERVVKSLLGLGFKGYLLIGSDKSDVEKAIETVSNDGRFFSVGVADIAMKYFGSN